MELKTIKIYTDGSCHTQFKIGAWAAIILNGEEKNIIKGTLQNTTHNQMELISVINAIKYIEDQNLQAYNIEVYSDSQYVVDLQKRKEKLELNFFYTKAGKEVQNVHLLKTLIGYLKNPNIKFIKVEAHQKVNNIHNYNREVDILVRKTLREKIRLLNT